jgi:hypothetical protein
MMTNWIKLKPCISHTHYDLHIDMSTAQATLAVKVTAFCGISLYISNLNSYAASIIAVCEYDSLNSSTCRYWLI